MVYNLAAVDGAVVFEFVLGVFFFILFFNFYVNDVKHKHSALVLSGIFFLLGFILFMSNAAALDNNPNYYCPQHPDDTKCILVNESCPNEDSGILIKVHLNPIIYGCAYGHKNHKNWDTIKNYRFKTDCEINPREDAECVCDEPANTMIIYYANTDGGNGTKNIKFSNKNTTISVPAYYQISGAIYLDSFITKIETIENTTCFQSHLRTPAERCEYFNLSAVYNLNHTEIVGCS